MGFVTSAERVVCRAMAGTMAPPLPPDITRWCVENIEFDERSPIKGPFDISRFAFSLWTVVLYPMRSVLTGFIAATPLQDQPAAERGL